MEFTEYELLFLSLLLLFASRNTPGDEFPPKSWITLRIIKRSFYDFLDLSPVLPQHVVLEEVGQGKDKISEPGKKAKRECRHLFALLILSLPI